MRILVITDGTDTNFADPTCVANPASCDAGVAYQDWVNTLQREGVPYTSLVTNGASPGSVALPALSSTLPNGTQVANYEGVIVAVSGTVGLTDAQWTALQTFEHQFSVRQVTAYTVPSSDYGLGSASPAGGAQLPLSTPLTLTASGAKVFPYLKQVAVDPTQSTWAYEAQPLPGASVDTLITGPNSSTLLGIYTAPDGRETMFQTFNESQYYLQSELLRHGELDWLARNTYFGDQRNYLEMDIDDTFTPDDVWDTATHSIDYDEADAMRMNPGDVATAASWEASHDFRMDQLFNMGGSAAYQADNGGTDPLLAAFQATCSSDCGPANAGAGKPYGDAFGWISHTYDTPYLDVGCATQNYIEAELNENTNVAHEAIGGTPGTGGLGLAETTDPSLSLGYEDAQVFVPGNHSGFADLVPGNPATVDPPELDTDLTTASATGGTLPAGTYEYAVTDQFTNSSTAGQSAASVTPPIDVATGATNEITVDWQAICHAADYVVYRGYTATQNATTGFAWTRLPAAAGSAFGAVSTPFEPTSANTGNPASTTDVTGGGEPELTYTDTGAAGTATTEPSTSAENAIESPWEQNQWFIPALEAVGITAVGDDASKPYPSPPDTQFGIGAGYTGATYSANSTFLEGTAQVVPRHPVNIYYNAATDAQELDEYQTLYPAGSFACPTACNFRDVITQVVSGMFATVMANDPRPSYVHQTNIIGSPPPGSEESPDLLPPVTYTPPATCAAGAPCTQGDGTLYQALDPLLYQYNAYFQSNAPIVQLTEQAIANLLAEQQAWAASAAVSGDIEGKLVTVNNSGPALETPLTGTNVGTPYAGTQSGWTLAPSGTSTYSALAAWPAAPTGPVIPTPPTGSAPGNPAGKLAYIAIQTAPKTVSMKHDKVTVALKCVATRGKTKKGHVCAGHLTLKVAGRSIRHNFRFKSGKVDRIAVTLPKRVRARLASFHRKHRKLIGGLVISTKQAKRAAAITYGRLTIKS
ncbi:MAG TPA: hypothetical protein VMA77_04610 [Solirubrobacteraceae bacterium]|nr:hypothetical protein [Solirubrobacteraceae bacterium]